MKKGGIGGGNTITGITFEKERDVLAIIDKIQGYSVMGSVISFEGKEVARSYKKHDLYRFLQEKGIDYSEIISKKLLPDEALYVIVNNTLFIIEMKSQETAGSVD